MHYFRFRQGVVLAILAKTLPVERFALSASIKPFQYHAFRQAVKLIQRRHIAAHTIVLVMTSQLSTKNRPPFLCFLVLLFFYSIFRISADADLRMDRIMAQDQEKD